MVTRDEYPQPDVIPPQTPEPEVSPPRHAMNRSIAGAILLMIGLVTLAANLSHSDIIGLLVLPVVGILFLVAAFMGRLPGLLIPGSIITGLGLGTLVQQTAFTSANGETRGAVIVIGLALGFLAIMPLTQILHERSHWWPVIPGGILLIVGIALWAGPAGATFLQVLGTLWPLALIAVGIYLLWRVYREPHRHRHGIPG